MEEPAATTEHQQLFVEINAEITAFGRSADVSQATYDFEQGRKLIEKAVSVGPSGQSYADLQRSITSFDGAKRRSVCHLFCGCSRAACAGDQARRFSEQLDG